MGTIDGIGFETAKILVYLGHNVLIHGRNKEKLKSVEDI
jgi:short-subunit dehydrogenase